MDFEARNEKIRKGLAEIEKKYPKEEREKNLKKLEVLLEEKKGNE